MNLIERVAADQARTARRQAAPPPDHGPAFTDYKAREAAILAEVLARDSFPGGMSREAYLEERLAEARREAYGE